MSRRSDAGRRGTRAFLAMLVCAVVLAGCARLPMSGPVIEVAAGDAEEVEGVQYVPSPPVAGASPTEIVAGFLQAGTGASDDFEVAREFLTSEFANSWNPAAGVLVVTDVPDVVDDGGDGSTVVTVDVTATVGADGVYADLPQPARKTLEIEVENVDGEWRVSSAPDGIVVLSTQFQAVFEPVTLYFLDAAKQALVPDVRWLPAHTGSLTDVVQALLKGPAEWLRAGEVTTAFPPDTLVRSVIVDDAGVADVDFTAQVASGPSEAFPLMALQLQHTLMGGDDGVRQVRMKNTNQEINVGELADSQVAVTPEVNATPLVYQNGVLGLLAGGNGVTELEGAERLSEVLGGLDPKRGVVSVENRIGAFTTERGTVAIPFDTGEPRFLTGGFDSVVPSIDRGGYIWTASATGPAVVAENVSENVDRSLQVPGMAGAGVVALEVSREGARVAMLVRDGDVVRLAIMAIVRDDIGAPVALGTPVVMDVDGAAVDLAWVGATTVVTLTNDATESAKVWLHEVGGTSSDFGGLANAAHIVGSNRPAGIRAVDQQGYVFVPKSGRWAATGAKVSFLVRQA